MKETLMTFEEWYEDWIDNGTDLGPKDLAEAAWNAGQENVLHLLYHFKFNARNKLVDPNWEK